MLNKRADRSYRPARIRRLLPVLYASTRWQNRRTRALTGFALIYLVLSQVAHLLRPEDAGDAIFWGLSGISVAAASYFNRRWRRQLVAVLIAVATLDGALHGAEPASAFAMAIANGVECYIGGTILALRIPQRRRIIRMQDIGWLLTAAVAGSAASTLLAVGASNLTAATVSWETSGYWFMSNMVSIFVGAPVLLAFLSLWKEPAAEPMWGRVLALVFATGVVLAGSTWASYASGRNFSYLVIVPLVGAAVWIGHRGAAPMVGGVAIALAAMTMGGYGPFAATESTFDPLVATQMFMAVVQATVLTVGIESSRRRDLIAELDGILEATVEAVLVIDEEGVIRKANRGAELLLVAPRGLVGTRIDTYIAAFDDLQPETGLSQVEVRNGKGMVFWSEVSQGDIREKSGRHRRAVVLRDVTERIETENRVRRLQDQFVSNMTHELKTPLTAIIGFTDWLLDQPDSPTLLEDLATIKSSAVSMQQLIDEILAFKRVLETAPVPEPVDLGRVVTDVVTLARPDAATRGVSIQAVVSPTPAVLGDPAQLEQVVGNLVSNAVKYSKAEGSVAVQLGPGEAGVKLRIADNGIGIPAADQERLFERFFRARNVGGTPGTGLGLAMVRQIVEAHQGTLRLTSEEGVGTVIDISLPVTAHERSSEADLTVPA